MSPLNFEVANGDVVDSIPRLPLPLVHYPGHYGTFFAFAEDRQAPLRLCSCSREPVEHYVRLRLSEPTSEYADPARMYVLDSFDFPGGLVQALMDADVPSDARVLQHISYGDKLCHECNRTTPSLRYCLPMYGGIFRQKYGWYINKQQYEFGISRWQDRILEDVCPQEVRDLYELDPAEAETNRRQLQQTDPKLSREVERAFGRRRRRVSRAVENEVRRKFGHKSVGDAWTSETILYHLVRTQFSEEPVLRHCRPDFLEGLELDVFLPERRVGIEYQGIQHFEPVGHWGGEEALARVQERDRRKKLLCRESNVRLVYFYHDENLSAELVRTRVESHRVSS